MLRFAGNRLALVVVGVIGLLATVSWADNPANPLSGSGSRARRESPPEEPKPPPEGERRTITRETTSFREAHKRVDPCVMMVIAGNGKEATGHGTGFVISKDNFLVATNAHVAQMIDLSQPTNSWAILQDSTKSFHIERIYFHPATVWEKRLPGKIGKVYSLSDQPYGEMDSPVFAGPDVAVLQLKKREQLSDEVTMATWDELLNLQSAEVERNGYPKNITVEIGKYPGFGELAPVSDKTQGSVNRLVDLYFKQGVSPETRRLIQFDAEGLGGASGSPVYLENGHVVGAYFGTRSTQDRNRVRHQELAVRIDSLWELICYRGLMNKVKMPANWKVFSDRKRWETYPSGDMQEVLRLSTRLLSANQRCLAGQYEDAIRDCEDMVAKLPAETDDACRAALRQSAYEILGDSLLWKLNEQWHNLTPDAKQEMVKRVLDEVAPGTKSVYGDYLRMSIANKVGLNNQDESFFKQTIDIFSSIVDLAKKDEVSVPDDVAGSMLGAVGTAHLQLKNLDKAKECFDNAVALLPNDPAVYMDRGRFRKSIGLVQEGEDDLRKADELSARVKR